MKYESLVARKWYYFFTTSAFFPTTNINWKCKRFYIYEGYEGYIYIQVFISVFFLFQTDFLYILIVHTEKIIIYRSYFHILCFPGQRKLKNLPSLWNISKPSEATEFSRSISKQTVCFLCTFCTNYVLFVQIED